MADINPLTTFHLALTEKEYNLMMLALASVASNGAVKPSGAQRREAAELNLQLLQRQAELWQQRVVANARKLEMAPAPPVEEPDV